MAYRPFKLLNASERAALARRLQQLQSQLARKENAGRPAPEPAPDPDEDRR